MKRLGIVLASALLLVATAACATPAASTQSDERPPTESQPQANTDPRKGKVVVLQYDTRENTPQITKICDGTTLVYYLGQGYRGGLSTIPSSPECKPS